MKADRKPNQAELSHPLFQAGRKSYERESFNPMQATIFMRGWLFAAADNQLMSFEQAVRLYAPQLASDVSVFNEDSLV